MAEGNGSDNGGKDRATVALVDAKIDGLTLLFKSELANLREDIRPFATMVTQVALLERDMRDTEKRVNALEKGKEKAREDEKEAQRIAHIEEADAEKERRNYRRVQIPAFILSGIALVVTILSQLNIHL